NLANSHMTAGELVFAFNYLKEATDLFRELGEQADLTLRLTMMGNIQMDLGKLANTPKQARKHFAEALDLYTQTLRLARMVQDTTTEAQLLSNIGRIYLALEQYDRAVEYFYSASQLYNTLGMEAEYRQCVSQIEQGMKLIHNDTI
ncbi:MAG TPA: tetratricopeptide repeat protein, partial [Aggregatilineales bacterium]|nr:tetratricopeptide repeat protein [Aggregatilineales bacterium]